MEIDSRLAKNKACTIGICKLTQEVIKEATREKVGLKTSQAPQPKTTKPGIGMFTSETVEKVLGKSEQDKGFELVD